MPVVPGISSNSQLAAFTCCSSAPSSPQVGTTLPCFGRPTTVLLLTREDGKHGSASLIEAVTVQLTLVGILGKLYRYSCKCRLGSISITYHFSFTPLFYFIYLIYQSTA